MDATGLPAESILDHLGTGVLVCDTHLGVQSINVSAQAILNVSLKQAVGQPLNALGRRASLLATIARRALNSEKRFTERAVQLAPDDRQSRVDLHYTPVQDDLGLRLLIELIPAEHPLALADAEQSAQHQAAMQALLRGLAHEIKNPLGGLRGAAQLMDRELEDQHLRQYTRVIIDEADRLVELLDRFQRPVRQPQHKSLNVHRALERVRQLSTARYAGQMSVKTDYDPSIPDVLGDLDRLVQGLLNLANNAAEAGATQLTLSTRIRRHLSLGGSSIRSALSMDFIDNGSGVDDAMGDLVFYPLVSGRSEGSGLGLSIAQTIAAEHGGQIICRSSPGHTVFSWLLPVKLDEPLAESGEGPQEQRQAASELDGVDPP